MNEHGENFGEGGDRGAHLTFGYKFVLKERCGKTYYLSAPYSKERLDELYSP